MACFKHDFSDPDPNIEYKTTIDGINYHEVIGEQCQWANCNVTKLSCFKADNKTLNEPDVIYELNEKQIQERLV